MANDASLRKHLIALLGGGEAHANFDRAVAKLDSRLRGVVPPGAEHSPWQLLEHLRIAQWDILEFSRNPEHISPEFPAGYWPLTAAPPDEAAWERGVQAFRRDAAAMSKLVAEGDLYTPFPHGEGQTLLREALLLADHNAYHLGQLVLVRRLLGAWE